MTNETDLFLVLLNHFSKFRWGIFWIYEDFSKIRKSFRTSPKIQKMLPTLKLQKVIQKYPKVCFNFRRNLTISSRDSIFTVQALLVPDFDCMKILVPFSECKLLIPTIIVTWVHSRLLSYHIFPQGIFSRLKIRLRSLGQSFQAKKLEFILHRIPAGEKSHR